MTAPGVPPAPGEAPPQDLWGAYREILRRQRQAPEIRPGAQVGEWLPLAPVQQRLWILHELDPATPLYNVARAFELRGPLEVAILDASLREIVRRHGSLRTGFREEEGQPVQRIADEAAMETMALERIDLAGLPEARRDAELPAVLAALARRLFDLAAPPLFRPALLRLGPERHVLLVAVHHLVFDGVSLRNLWRELASLYTALSEGRTAELPELPVQYADFALWQRRLLEEGAFDAQLAAWTDRLAGAPPVLDLPGDRPRPTVRTPRGVRRDLALPSALADRLRALGRAEGTTFFMVLLAAFDILLFRLTGRSDLVVGTPAANRGRREIRDLVGFFVNTLALRTRVEEGLTATGLLQRARETVTDAFTRQDLPVDRLVEELRLERIPGCTPLFQVLLVLQGAPLAGVRLPGLQVAPLGFDPGTAMFDLTIEVEEGDGDVTAFLEASTDLFDPPTVLRLAGCFQTLLEGLAAAPESRIEDLPLLTEGERQAVLAEWSGAFGEDGAEAAPVYELFRERAGRWPAAPAVLAPGETVTYGELARRVERLAGRLRQAGVGPDVPVGLCFERSPELIAALLAVLAAGGACVPLDPALPRERRMSMLESAGAPLVLAGRQAAGELAGGGRAVVCLDGPEADVPIPPLLRSAHGPLRPEGLAYVLFTSGSQGQPKGVQIAHRSLSSYVAFAGRAFELTPGDRVLQFASIGFDTAAEEIFPCLISGACLVLRSGSMLDSVPVFLESCSALRISVLDLPTAWWHEWTAWLQGRETELWPELRLVILGGESALPERLAAWRRAVGSEVRLLNTYGPTETTVVATLCDLTAGPEVPEAHPVPIGRPIPAARAFVADRSLRPVPLGIAGELCLGGTGLARGYAGDPARTAERFVPDPLSLVSGTRLYRTGDRARHLPGGQLEFLGRVDDQVKVRGFRIEPGEIEAALAGHPAVAGSAVAYHRQGGRGSLTAYVVPQPGHRLDPGRLRAFLGERLPEPWIPGVFVELAALPLNVHGKVDRRALPPPLLAPAERPAPPETPLEQAVAGVWREVLDRPEIGRDEDFFQLGGHSLLAGRVLARLAARCGVRLTLRTFFEGPTVAGLARSLLRQDPRLAAETSAPPVRQIHRVAAPGRPLPLSFAQERLWFFDRLAPGSPAYTLTASFALRGRLDAGALERALAVLGERHASLRTTFTVEGDRPVQVIAGRADLPLRTVDLAALPPDRREAEARRLTAEEARLPFDLETGPLLRVRRLRLEDDFHWLALTMHHIVSDGWSMEVLLRELGAAYGACAAGRAPELPELPIDYADFAVWQREQLQGEELREALAWWQESLAGAPGCTLPPDRPRPPVQTTRAFSVSRVLPPPVAAGLRDLARRESASLFMTLLTVFAVLVRRHAGQTDLVIGAPVAGRTGGEVEGLVGFFINTLALRLDLSGDPPFRELLGRVRRVALGALAHQDLPFEKLVEELRPERDLSRTPIFQLLFNLLNVPDQPLRLPGLSVEALPALAAEAKFDLTLYAEEQGGGISLVLVGNADLFDADRMDDFLAQLGVLAAAVALDPDGHIDRFPLRTPVSAALLPDPARTLPPGSWEGGVAARFMAWARRTPERTAVIDSRESLDYRTVAERSGKLARRLRAAGVAPEEVVAVLAQRSASLVWILLGILSAGAAFLILDPADPAGLLVRRLRMARPRAWVRCAGASSPPELDEYLAEDADLRLQLNVPEELEGPDEVEDLPGSEVEIRPDTLAYVAFTSGTTGLPKGILGSHRPLDHFVGWHARTFGLGPDDRFSALSGLSHDPLLRDLFTPLCNGATVCLPDQSRIGSPGWLAGWLAESGITVVHLTPAMADLLSASSRGAVLPGLRYLFCGGDALDGATVERLRALAPRARCVNFYGTTETPQAIAFHPVDAGEGAHGERIPVGRGIDGAQLLVVGPGTVPAAVGELGEIWVRSPFLARGDLGESAETARFRVNPFSGDPGDPADRVYPTGDLGRYRPDGEVLLLGRLDHQVKIRGYRVEPGEIEAALESDESIARAAVMARADSRGGTRLVGFVVPANGHAPAVQDVRRHLARLVPAWAVPAAWVVLEALPLTPNGKVDRAALARLDPGERPEHRGRPPRDEMERRLTGIWQDLFGGPVQVEDNFFDLGGHSLLAVRLMARIEEELAVSLPLAGLFQAQTIEELAALLRETQGASAEAP